MVLVPMLHRSATAVGAAAASSVVAIAVVAAARAGVGPRGARSRARPGEEGQATVEYALVVLAAATIALLFVAWAARTGKVGELFDRVFDRATAGAG